MVNWEKRVTDFTDNKLQSYEQVIGVAFLQPPGAIADATAKASFGLLGALFAGMLNKKRREKAEGEASKMSGGFPSGPVIVASTSKGRILCYEQAVLSGKPKKFIKEYAHGDFRVSNLKPGTLKTNMTLAFNDGCIRTFELAKGQDYNKFAESLG